MAQACCLLPSAWTTSSALSLQVWSALMKTHVRLHPLLPDPASSSTLILGNAVLDAALQNRRAEQLDVLQLMHFRDCTCLSLLSRQI